MSTPVSANSRRNDAAGQAGWAYEWTLKKVDANLSIQETMPRMYPRPLTPRERAVLTALLAEEFDGVERLRAQASEAQVFGGCGCGCPSVDFFEGGNEGMTVVVNADVTDSETFDGLFLYTVHMPGVGEILGGMEWVGQSEASPDELPAPENLIIAPASP